MEAKCFSCFFTALLLRRLVGVARASCDFPAIFDFGDSKSDAGGLSAVFGQAPWHEGETYFHRPARRYTDGHVLVDFIAESLGLPYPSAYLDLVGSNFGHGANFATAGSTIRPQNFSSRGSAPSLSTFSSTSSVTELQWLVKKDIGEVFEKLLPEEEVFPEVLYTFDIGQTDLAAGFSMNVSTSEVRACISDFRHRIPASS